MEVHFQVPLVGDEEELRRVAGAPGAQLDQGTGVILMEGRSQSLEPVGQVQAVGYRLTVSPGSQGYRAESQKERQGRVF